jgi:hypothetical protein
MLAMTMMGVGVAWTAPAYADTWSTGTSGTITSGTTTKVGVGNTSPAAQLDVSANTSAREGLIVNQVQTNAPIARFRQNGTTKVLVTNSGQLGIGTTTPTQNLHVVGNALITGSLQADGGLKVKTWSIEAPDYVFSADNKLRTLSEVETFVKQNHHLPEVPSAGDLKKDGMDIAEMNLRLLKKVEELTLYAIEQDKRIRDLSAKLEAKSVSGPTTGGK